MKKLTKNLTERKIRRINPINLICWIIVPLAILGSFVLDGLGVYTFSSERIIVLGIGIFVMLIPFFSEITVKNISLKKERRDK